MKKIRITLRRDGTQIVEVLDAVGPDCREFSRAFEERLGIPEGDRVFKPEYYESDSESEHEQDYEQEKG